MITEKRTIQVEQEVYIAKDGKEFTEEWECRRYEYSLDQNALVGFYIRKAREDRGLTRKQLAELACVTEGTIVDWELRGRNPCVYNLIPVADALKISLDELVGREIPKED